jgi:hypothetical protein
MTTLIVRIVTTSFFDDYFYGFINHSPLKTRELTTVAEMLNNIELMRFLYQPLRLRNMKPISKTWFHIITSNWQYMRMIFAVTGFWTATKLWSGRYIEIDNFIVHLNIDLRTW